MLSHWISAFRLRTLPLAFSSVVVGSGLADYYGRFRWEIFVLALLTTLSLQILANLANDFGDTQHGLDNEDRIGPKRTMQQGEISYEQMRWAIVLFILLSSLFGVPLIIMGVGNHLASSGLIIAILGISAIISAMKYTMGSNPYGYAGFGDIAVLIFFGLIGVAGTFFLHMNQLPIEIFLPSMGIGLLSVGVLNINNMRDLIADEKHGKRTVAVMLGRKNARKYHLLLILLSFLTLLWYSWEFCDSAYRFVYLVIFPPILNSSIATIKTEKDEELDSQLKILALSTFVLSILFWIGLTL